MKTTFLYFVCFVLLLFGISNIAWCDEGYTTASNPEPKKATSTNLELCKSHILDMKAKISLLNLINGLHLTDKQIEVIIEGASELNTLRGDNRKNRRGDKEEDIQALREKAQLLEEARKKLLAGSEIPQSFFAQFQRLNNKNTKNKLGNVNPQEEIHKKTLDWEKKIEQTLTTAQLEVLKTFKPCLIPLKNLKDPVRVGQASDTTHSEEALKRIRSVPEAVWQERKLDIIGHLLNMTQRKVGEYNEAEMFVQTYAWLVTAEKARKMNDADFEISKGDLAKEFEPYDKTEELKKQAESLAKKANASGDVARFLLDPDIIPLLKQRLYQMRHPDEVKSTNLNKIEGVQKEKGKCAID